MAFIEFIAKTLERQTIYILAQSVVSVQTSQEYDHFSNKLILAEGAVIVCNGCTHEVEGDVRDVVAKITKALGG